MKGDEYGRLRAPLRRFREAAYWYHAKKRHAWKPEYDYHLRAFAQAFVSALEALERVWAMNPKPDRSEEMQAWWDEKRADSELEKVFTWVKQLRTREFHTLRKELPPYSPTAVGFQDTQTDGFIAFLHHQIPGDSGTVEQHVNRAFFSFKKLLIEFGTRFDLWREDDVHAASSFPDALKDTTDKPEGPVYEIDIGPGPYKGFGPKSRE